MFRLLVWAPPRFGLGPVCWADRWTVSDPSAQPGATFRVGGIYKGLVVYDSPTAVDFSMMDTPRRLFRVQPRLVTRDSFRAPNQHRGWCWELTVLEEVPHTLAWGPRGPAISVLASRARDIGREQARQLAAVTGDRTVFEEVRKVARQVDLVEAANGAGVEVAMAATLSADLAGEAEQTDICATYLAGFAFKDPAWPAAISALRLVAEAVVLRDRIPSQLFAAAVHPWTEVFGPLPAEALAGPPRLGVRRQSRNA